MKHYKQIWVEVFDCIYGHKKEQYYYEKNSAIPDEIQNIISKMQDMTDESLSKEEMDEIFLEEMGLPTEITEYEEGNIQYIKKVWEIGEKKIVRIMATVKDGVDYEDLSLEEKMKIAIQNEEYEKAAELKKEIENQNFINILEDPKEKKKKKKRSNNQEDKEKKIKKKL